MVVEDDDDDNDAPPTVDEEEDKDEEAHFRVDPPADANHPFVSCGCDFGICTYGNPAPPEEESRVDAAASMPRPCVCVCPPPKAPRPSPLRRLRPLPSSW